MKDKYLNRHDCFSWCHNVKMRQKLEFLKTSHRYHRISEAMILCHGTIKLQGPWPLSICSIKLGLFALNQKNQAVNSYEGCHLPQPHKGGGGFAEQNFWGHLVWTKAVCEKGRHVRMQSLANIKPITYNNFDRSNKHVSSLDPNNKWVLAQYLGNIQ